MSRGRRTYIYLPRAHRRRREPRVLLRLDVPPRRIDARLAPLLLVQQRCLALRQPAAQVRLARGADRLQPRRRAAASASAVRRRSSSG
eukprot:jgi/Tetstr1/445879/TSEL_033518.t1